MATLTCTSAQLVTTVGNAATGDTILVSSGSTTGFELTKHVSIIGGNGGGTTAFTGGFTLNPDKANNALCRVSNFTFNGGTVTMGDGSYLDCPYTICDQVRLDHCTFINQGTDPMYLYLTFYGVVDNCVFGAAGDRPDGYYICRASPNNSNVAGKSWWANSPQNVYTAGSNKFLYFEDNIFYASDRITMMQYSARAAFRYNTIDYTGAQGIIELHGSQGEMEACFGAEIYGNRCTGGDPTLLSIRGGTGLVFYNSWNSQTPAIYGYVNTSVQDCPARSPALQSIHDVYAWGNRANYTGALTTASIGTQQGSCGGKSNIPTLGRDIMVDAATTPGVGMGTLANRPGGPALYQGYWATNQSTTNLTNLTGDINTYPSRQTISGTLYYCKSAGTWTDSYTPYTYPHPLRGGAVAAPVGNIAASLR